ncbi:MAG: 23S rRNA (guanosine(2251)-2'-O)-methyltransferase RlmB [Nitrospinales bacterium]
MREKPESLVYGINPVLHALKLAQRACHKIVVEQGRPAPRIRPLLESARRDGIRVETLPRAVFGKKYPGRAHQGIVGHFSPKATLPLDELIRRAFEQTPQPTLAVLDCIQDPRNLGAIIRSAEAQGIQGIVLPKNRSAPLNETVAKCSAGAVESIPIATATNLAKALETLKSAGFWIVGVDMAGEKPCGEFAFDSPTALVLGGEEKGIRPLLKRACDFTVCIPMSGTVGSLNVSTAGAILFYEILRQKRRKPG